MSRWGLVIFLTVHIFQSGCDALERRSAEELLKDNNALSSEILLLKSEAYLQLRNISETIFNNWKPSFFTHFEAHFPACYRKYFEEMISELQEMFTEAKPPICHTELENIEETTDTLLGESIRLKKSVLDLKQYKNSSHSIGFNNEYTKIQKSLEQIKDRVGKFHNVLQSNPWSDLTWCYNHVASQIDKKIAELRASNSTCDSITTFDHFLSSISLTRYNMFEYIENYDHLGSMNVTLERKLDTLKKRYQIDMVQAEFATNDFHRKMSDAAEQMFSILKPQLDDRLRDDFPSCNTDFIDHLLADIYEKILESSSSECPELHNSLNDVITSITELSTFLVIPKLEKLTSCIMQKRTCDVNKLYDQTVRDLARIERWLLDLQFEVTPTQPILMEECYDDIASKIKAKISQLTPLTSTCRSDEKYEDFLKDLQLWPFTLDVMMNAVPDPKMELFVVPGGTSRPHMVSVTGLAENEWLRRQLMNLTLETRYYLEYIESQVEPLFNESYTEVLRRFRVIDGEERLKNPPSCYAHHIQDVEEQLKEYYQSRIYPLCLDPYLELIRNFELITQSHLPTMNSQLMQDYDCREPGLCQMMTSYMILIEDGLAAWKSFNFTNTREFYKSCSNTANHIIETNLQMDRKELRNCQLVTFANNIGRFLPTNSETYPSYIVLN